jgi:hypothetical protein
VIAVYLNFVEDKSGRLVRACRLLRWEPRNAGRRSRKSDLQGPAALALGRTPFRPTTCANGAKKTRIYDIASGFAPAGHSAPPPQVKTNSAGGNIINLTSPPERLDNSLEQ